MLYGGSVSRLKEMISELIDVNRAVLNLLERQQRQQDLPERAEMLLGSADDTIQRYKALSRQKRSIMKEKIDR